MNEEQIKARDENRRIAVGPHHEIRTYSFDHLSSS